MAALYIHIPFCTKKCDYCDFVSYAGRAGDMKDYVAAVCREIHYVRLKYGAMHFSSVFIGGGTPSLLPVNLLDEMMNTLSRYFVITSLTEVTMEANPGTLDSEKLIACMKLGVNRLSLGAQASQNRLLRAIGRIHVWDDVVQSVYMARAAGFLNINLDLMYGLPGQTREDWAATLKRAAGLRVEHLSCYSLTLEEGTPLYDRVNMPGKDNIPGYDIMPGNDNIPGHDIMPGNDNIPGHDIMPGKIIMPDEDDERGMYDDAIRMLDEAGFKHYEISNWSKPKMTCRHNLAYWHNDNYIGVGCGAHSCMDSYRYENTPDITEYIRLIERGEAPVVSAQGITREGSMFETVMLELRLLKGLDMLAFRRRYGESYDAVFGQSSVALETQGLLERKGHFIRLTRKGLDLQNSVLVALMKHT